MMTELIEAIRTAVTEGATAEQKATGAQACRTILTALGAEPGKPISVPGAPLPPPLASISADQALSLIIARLTTIAEAKDAQEAQANEAATASAAPSPSSRTPAAPQIAFVNPPARARATAPTSAAPASTRRRTR